MKKYIYLVRIRYGYEGDTIFEDRIVAGTIEKAMERARVVFKKENGAYSTAVIVRVERLESVYV